MSETPPVPVAMEDVAEKVVVPWEFRMAFDMAESGALIGKTENFIRDAVTGRRIQHRCLGKGRGIVLTREDLQLFLDSHIVEVQQ